MVVDGVQGLVPHSRLSPPGDPSLQQRGIEDRLLRRRVQFQERAQPRPHRRQRSGVRAPDLLQDREQPPLLVMIVKDQLGDVHQPSRYTEDNSTPATKQATVLRRG